MGIFFKDAENPTGDDYDALDDWKQSLILI